MISIKASQAEAVFPLTVTLLIPLASTANAGSDAVADLILVNVLFLIVEFSQFWALMANTLQELNVLFSMRIFRWGCPGVYIWVPTPAARFLNTLS